MIEQPVKRPVGMTILLVLSLINAIYQLFSSLFTYLFAPVMREMLENGQFEDSLRLFMPNADEAAFETVMNGITMQLELNPTYYLILFVLFLGSLIGVIKMFKLQRTGFHIYSISQLLILIAGVVFIYSKQAQSGFFSEFLTTLFFILIYHLYLKRIEFQERQLNQNNHGQTEGE